MILCRTVHFGPSGRLFVDYSFDKSFTSVSCWILWLIHHIIIDACISENSQFGINLPWFHQNFSEFVLALSTINFDPSHHLIRKIVGAIDLAILLILKIAPWTDLFDGSFSHHPHRIKFCSNTRWCNTRSNVIPHSLSFRPTTFIQVDKWQHSLTKQQTQVDDKQNIFHLNNKREHFKRINSLHSLSTATINNS